MNAPDLTLHKKSPDSQGELALIARLLHDYIGGRVGSAIFAMLCMGGTAVMTAALAWLLDPAVKQIFIEKNPAMLTLIPIGVVVVVLVRGAFDYGGTALNNAIGQSIVADTQRDMFRSLNR